MDFGKVMQLALLLCLVAGCICMPRGRAPSRLKRLFLDVNCDQPPICPKKASPICCTDGNTYSNYCMLSMENQRRICHEGKFNPIAKVHSGPCVTTTEAP